MKIGIAYGNPETTTGGLALKFYSTIRIEIRKIESLKKGDEHYGNRVKAKIVKNKMAAPFKQAEFDIIFGKGISKAGCLLDAAISSGVIQRKGTWYFLGEERIAQGRDNLLKDLEEKAPLLNKIETLVRKKLAEGVELTSPSSSEKIESAEEE